jgi:hypothetical protein
LPSRFLQSAATLAEKVHAGSNLVFAPRLAFRADPLPLRQSSFGLNLGVFLQAILAVFTGLAKRNDTHATNFLIDFFPGSITMMRGE